MENFEEAIEKYVIKHVDETGKVVKYTFQQFYSPNGKRQKRVTWQRTDKGWLCQGTVRYDRGNHDE